VQAKRSVRRSNSNRTAKQQTHQRARNKEGSSKREQAIRKQASNAKQANKGTKQGNMCQNVSQNLLDCPTRYYN
jgi:hypothetical protein